MTTEESRRLAQRLARGYMPSVDFYDCVEGRFVPVELRGVTLLWEEAWHPVFTGKTLDDRWVQATAPLIRWAE